MRAFRQAAALSIEASVQCQLYHYTLRAGDCVSDVDLWPRVDSSDIHEFLVRRTSFITREQLKSRKALEGHNFVTSGWVREPWVKKVAAYTVIVVTHAVPTPRKRLHSTVGSDKKMAAYPECTASPPYVQAPYTWCTAYVFF
ncbi:hypothetical protein HPB50_012990 [Hyalomma asiaticum]|uniref:Uncharacterized protein n=1 Tax=Hyalomma asiaticum TaxID=266040 RepID=A0ACB7T7Z0_HYAAI|nr:hypothetical protein HPB50_012990 [Hyalomma asiaticum]